jgi:hypothetical protein
MKPWPKRVVTVPEYDCTIKFYDPTIAQLNAIDVARKAKDEEKVKALVMELVCEWDAIDKNGQPVPTTVEGLNQSLPPLFLGTIVDGIIYNVVPKGSDPKGSACESSLTIQPEPEGTGLETLPLKQ